MLVTDNCTDVLHGADIDDGSAEEGAMKTSFAVAMSNSGYAGQLVRSTWRSCRQRLESHRTMAQIRQMDDHMLRQFGLSRIIVETL